MTTILNDTIETGDVLEIIRDGESISALVLLAADHAVILDACDGSTPFVVKRDELVEYRKFVPTYLSSTRDSQSPTFPLGWAP